jgi:hypothetical protein
MARRASARVDDAWRTRRGVLSASDLEDAVRGAGVRFDRSRRIYWQAHQLFPLPEVRWLSRPGVRGGSRGFYHAEAPSLAVLLDALLPRRAARERISPAQVVELLARWREQAASESPGDDAEAEERFYARVRRVLESRRDRDGAAPAERFGLARSSPPSRPVQSGPRRRRWSTIAGTLTVAELEGACAELGVRLDRSRRTYWQVERVFPQPEVRWLPRVGGPGGSRGYFHPGTPTLAVLVDYAVRRDHPAKPEGWRCPPRQLASLLARWRREARAETLDEQAAEDAFYARVRAAVDRIGHGEPIEGIDPEHVDVLPNGQRRLAEGEEAMARMATAAVVQAVADQWLEAHADEPSPDRLVVWFRLERTGPAAWRIAAEGARRTAHDAQRLREQRDKGFSSPFV